MKKEAIKKKIKVLDKKLTDSTNDGGTSMSEIQRLCEEINALQSQLDAL